MEEMLKIKKEIKQMLEKEFGSYFNYCFYMNKRQMANRTATIFVGMMFEDENYTFKQGGVEKLAKDVNERTKQDYIKLSEVLNKYNYKFNKEITNQGDWQIRLYF